MSPQTFARMLYTHLNAEEVDCPAAVSEMIGGDQAVCAETDLQWRVIRKKTRLFLREYAPDDLPEHDLWDRDREFRRRQIMSTEEPVLLQFDIDRERFVILPHHPCFEPSLVESIGLVRLRRKVGEPAPADPQGSRGVSRGGQAEEGLGKGADRSRRTRRRLHRRDLRDALVAEGIGVRGVRDGLGLALALRADNGRRRSGQAQSSDHDLMVSEPTLRDQRQFHPAQVVPAPTKTHPSASGPSRARAWRGARRCVPGAPRSARRSSRSRAAHPT